MNENIDEMLQENMKKSIDGLVNTFDKKDSSIDEIYQTIKVFGEGARIIIYMTALTTGKKELAEKIHAANVKINNERINSFINSILNSTYEEFLSNLSFVEKISLKAEIQLYKSLDKIDIDIEKCLGIIEKSIRVDLEEEAKSQGFDSVEEWQRHNVQNSVCKPFYMKKSRFPKKSIRDMKK